MKTILAAALFLSFLFAKAQTADSIGSILNSPGRFFLKFDTKNSFITNTRADIWGVKTGIQFARKIKTGIGYSWLHTKLEKNIIITPDTVSALLTFNYPELYFEYVFYSTRRWEFSIPLQLAAGNSFYRYSLNGSKFVQDKHIMMLYEPAVSLQYKIVRWFGIGGDIGYRLVLVRNKAIPENFNSPLYSFKALIYYDELYEMIFKKPLFKK